MFVLGVSQIDCLLRPAAQGGTSRTKCAREPRPPREQATPHPCAGSQGPAKQGGKKPTLARKNTPGSPRRATRLARAGRGLRSLVGPHANLIHTQYTHHVVRPAAYSVQTLQLAHTHLTTRLASACHLTTNPTAEGSLTTLSSHGSGGCVPVVTDGHLAFTGIGWIARRHAKPKSSPQAAPTGAPPSPLEHEPTKPSTKAYCKRENIGQPAAARRQKPLPPQ